MRRKKKMNCPKCKSTAIVLQSISMKGEQAETYKCVECNKVWVKTHAQKSKEVKK